MLSPALPVQPRLCPPGCCSPPHLFGPQCCPPLHPFGLPCRCSCSLAGANLMPRSCPPFFCRHQSAASAWPPAQVFIHACLPASICSRAVAHRHIVSGPSSARQKAQCCACGWALSAGLACSSLYLGWALNQSRRAGFSSLVGAISGGTKGERGKQKRGRSVSTKHGQLVDRGAKLTPSWGYLRGERGASSLLNIGARAIVLGRAARAKRPSVAPAAGPWVRGWRARRCTT
jgi:hypothetical protein